MAAQFVWIETEKTAFYTRILRLADEFFYEILSVTKVVKASCKWSL